MSKTRLSKEKIIPEAYLPQDMVLLIALQMSAFDIPNLVLVYRFLAANSTTLWRHHTLRHFEHPPLLFPDEIKTHQMNWHGLFFKHYQNAHVIYRWWALQITEGNIDNLLAGKSPFKVLPCFEFMSRLFSLSTGNLGHPSLFQLTHV